MTAPEFRSPEELVAYLEQRLSARDFDSAQAAVRNVDTLFPDSPLAHHAAGLVWERTYLERNAEGKSPDVALFENAERHYRKALELDPANEPFHGPRLFTCLFILGSQQKDQPRLREALALATRLAENHEPEMRERYEREAAIVAAAIANASENPEDDAMAEKLFANAVEPEEEREAFFYHLYRGMLKRRFGQRDDDPRQLREAAASLRKALAISPRPSVEYLLADCLVQLQAPREEELAQMAELVRRLVQTQPHDPMVQGLQKRFEIRQKLTNE